MTVRGPAHFDGDEIYYDYPPYNNKGATEEAELVAKQQALLAAQAGESNLFAQVVWLFIVLAVMYVGYQIYKLFFDDSPLDNSTNTSQYTGATTNSNNNVNAPAVTQVPEPQLPLWKRLIGRMVGLEVDNIKNAATEGNSNGVVIHGQTTKTNTFTTVGGSPINRHGTTGNSMYEEMTRGGGGGGGGSPGLHLNTLLGGGRAPQRAMGPMFSPSPDMKQNNNHRGGGGGRPNNNNQFLELLSRDRGHNSHTNNMTGQHGRDWNARQNPSPQARGGGGYNDNRNNNGQYNNNNNNYGDDRYGTNNRNNNGRNGWEEQPVGGNRNTNQQQQSSSNYWGDNRRNNNSDGWNNRDSSPEASFVGSNRSMANAGGYNSRFDDAPVRSNVNNTTAQRGGYLANQRRGQAQERTQSPPDFDRINRNTRPNNNNVTNNRTANTNTNLRNNGNSWDDQPIGGGNNKNVNAMNDRWSNDDNWATDVGAKRDRQPCQWDENPATNKRRQDNAWDSTPACSMNDPGRQQNTNNSQRGTATTATRSYQFNQQRGPVQPQQRQQQQQQRQTNSWEDTPIGGTGGGRMQEDKFNAGVAPTRRPGVNNSGSDDRAPLAQRTTGTTRVTNTATNIRMNRNTNHDDKFAACVAGPPPAPRNQQGTTNRQFGTNLNTTRRGTNNNGVNSEFEEAERLAELDQLNGQQQRRGGQQPQRGGDQDLFDENRPIGPSKPAAGPARRPGAAGGGARSGLSAHIAAQRNALRVDATHESPQGRNAQRR